MPGDRAVRNFSGPFPDGEGLYDLPARVFIDMSVLRPADAALGSQVPQQLFFQHSARLDEQATVNGLVGHAQALVVGILGLQPSGNLFRRPTTVYSQRSPVAAHGERAGRVSAATPTSRLGHPLRWHDMQNGHHAGEIPGSPSTRRGPDAGRSYEALHLKRFLARYPLAPAV